MLVNNTTWFIHIPRVAGRWIKDTLKQNFNCEHDDWYFFRGKEVGHLTYPEHEQFLHYISFKKFCIVRDPIDRFVSCITGNNKITQEKFDHIMKSQEYLNEYINNHILNDFSNWYTPQTDFIDYKTKIWRLEDKFESNFYNWMEKNFNLKIKKIAPINPLHSITNDIEINLTEKHKEYIKNYYYKDYKLLNY